MWKYCLLFFMSYWVVKKTCYYYREYTRETYADDTTFRSLVKYSTRANSRLRKLKISHTNDEQDVIYVIHVTYKSRSFFKIGRTTLGRFYRRIREHVSEWGPKNLILYDVFTIQHPRVEEKFHMHMKVFKGGVYRANLKAHGKTYKEFYSNDTTVTDELNNYIILNRP